MLLTIMKRFTSIILTGAALLLGLVSCMKDEDRAIFDPSQCTAPVLVGYTVVDGAVSAEYTPAALNTNPKILNHMLAIVSLDGQPVSKRVNSTDKDGVLSVSSTNLTRALQELGCEEGSVHSLELAIRASNLKTPDDQNSGSFIESLGHIVIDSYEIILPSGDPYARYTQKSDWGLIGSFNGWADDYEMWTNGSLHVAKAVELEAGAEVKFRKDGSWDVNFGYAEGVSSYVLGEDFELGQGGANIVIAEAGKYDFILDPENATAKIIKSAVPQDDPYAAYTEESPWSVIGSFNSWGGDVEMVTNGTLHVCKKIAFAAGDEFKFRKDGSWDVNFGYAEGVSSYTLGEEFAVDQGGANIVIAEAGEYDLILDPENATAKIIKTQAVVVDPYATYTEESTWSVIGSFNSWSGDEPMVSNGILHVCKAIALNAGDEWKFRKDGAWAVNFGYAEGVSSYTLGEEFAVGQDGANIVVAEDGVYDFILDPENATAKVIKSIAADQPEPPAPVEKPKVWSLIGTLNGTSWDTDFDLTNTSGDIWVIRSVVVTASDEFKIRADHDWGKNVGGPEENATSTIDETNPYGVFKPELGKAFEAKDKNIQIGVAGVYDVTFDYAAMTILVEKHEAVYSLIGQINGDSWSVDVKMTEKDGVWTSPVVSIEGGFKIRYDYSWADQNTYGVESGFVPTVGTPFTAVQPGADITVDAGKYKVQFTPATKEVLITAVNFPEHLYMIGEEFGGWNWESDGVVEMTPVVYQPDWGEASAHSEGQFWAVRYISAGKGFKFNSERKWGGDFWGLTTNDGFTESGGNCTVAEDGIYLIHVDLKNEKVHVEPARVYGIGNCFGDWTEELEGALFEADGKTLKATVRAAGELRMYVASAISTSDWWTREFIILDGQIDYRGDDEGQGDQARVNVLQGQVVTLDFNAGTGSITGQGEAPALPETMYMIGDGIGGWDWAGDYIVNMTPVNGKAGQFWAIRNIEAGKGFKFSPEKAWGSDFYSLGEDIGFTTADGNCFVAESGVYMVYVDCDAKKICVEKAKVYGIGDCFGGWDPAMEAALFTEADGKLSATVAAAGELRMYAASSIATSDWWTREFIILDGKIAYRGNGGDQERVSVTAGQKVTLDFNAGTGTIE